MSSSRRKRGRGPTKKPVAKVESRPDAAGGRRPMWPLLGFGALVVVCVAVGVAYLLHARDRSEAQERGGKRVAVAGPASMRQFLAEPHMVFRSTAYGATYGKVAVVPLDAPNGPRALTPLECERVDMASGRGICLVANRGVLTTYGGLVFDSKFRVQHRFDLPGLPSRARVAPDGSVAAMTVFVSGDSYSASTFSTRTIFADLKTGALLGNLEDFHVTNNGSTVDAIDRNYWGVTFAPDSDTFYATLQTGGQIYLVKGKLSERSARVVSTDIECPSLSPDGTRIAYKKRIGSGVEVRWRLHVRDLASGKDVELTETRNVDDQVEWLDDANVLFGLPQADSGTAETNTWIVPADGSGKPRTLVPLAWSPSVVRAS